MLVLLGCSCAALPQQESVNCLPWLQARGLPLQHAGCQPRGRHLQGAGASAGALCPLCPLPALPALLEPEGLWCGGLLCCSSGAAGGG